MTATKKPGDTRKPGVGENGEGDFVRDKKKSLLLTEWLKDQVDAHEARLGEGTSYAIRDLLRKGLSVMGGGVVADNAVIILPDLYHIVKKVSELRGTSPSDVVNALLVEHLPAHAQKAQDRRAALEGLRKSLEGG